MIEITNLEKNFGDLEVLKKINLKIMDGEIYGLVGVSGAGKSTLLRCINGLESYSNGSLKVNGTEVKDLDKKQKKIFQKNIGMIFQHFPMLTRKTVYDNIAFPMKCWKYGKKEIDQRVKELAEIVGITDKLGEKPANLSGGQKQRVAIARALSMNPKILLSDEATSALDPKTTQSILALLKEINEKLGITIIIVTHQMEVVRQVCQKVSLLEGGKIVTSGDVEELFLKQPDALQSFLGRGNSYTVPDGTNIQILLQEKDASREILSKMARELQIDYMVCGGKMEQYRDKNLGEIVIHISDQDTEKVKQFLNDHDVIWHEYQQEG
nr:methionine ABC transporter ATP-binding protein [uncultured Merdimonas sp.]